MIDPVREPLTNGVRPSTRDGKDCWLYLSVAEALLLLGGNARSSWNAMRRGHTSARLGHCNAKHQIEDVSS